MMQGNVWLLILIAVAVVILVLWLTRRRYGRGAQPPHADRPVEGADDTMPPEVEAPSVMVGPAAAAVDGPAPQPVVPAPDAPPAPLVVPAAGPADDLSKLKGVGPKLITLLGTLGVTRYDQIAGWSDADIAAIDARLGTFQGRPTRDKWVEQAGYLASGDIAGFEAKFGKL